MNNIRNEVLDAYDFYTTEEIIPKNMDSMICLGAVMQFCEKLYDTFGIDITNRDSELFFETPTGYNHPCTGRLLFYDISDEIHSIDIKIIPWEFITVDVISREGSNDEYNTITSEFEYFSAYNEFINVIRLLKQQSCIDQPL